VHSESRIALVLGLTLSLLPSCAAQGQSTSSQTSQKTKPDPGKVFADGEAALKAGDLDRAELAFKSVLKLDPKSAAAEGNLGVVYMRRQRWSQALSHLESAARLDPRTPGIRLNIGLAYYRQGDFWHAIPPLESVVKDQPDSLQARQLLGISYFSTERYVEAADILQPLWPQLNGDMNYLYILSIAADKADRPQVSQRADFRMVEVGGDTPEFHLIMGKAKLNEEAYDDAIRELTTAANANPKLPFVHFYLAMALEKRAQYERAEEEFRKDIELEPDVVFNYNELGNLYLQMGKDDLAEKAFQHGLKLNSNMIEPHLGLAKVYQKQGENEKALAELDQAAALDPQSSNIPYMRGQLLIKMGRKDEGRKELERSIAMSHERREKRREELESPAPQGTLQPE
jgi:tetratricopeptide (TPR) repeat protein